MNNTQFKIGDKVKLISVEPYWPHKHWLNCTVFIVGYEHGNKYCRISLTNNIQECMVVFPYRLEHIGQMLLFEVS